MAVNAGTQQIEPGHYVNQTIDICRECKGSGGSSLSPNDVCSTCLGTGKVIIEKDIHFTVKPYKTNAL